MPKLHVTLCLAVTDQTRMAATVRTCAALGICDIRPVISDRVEGTDIDQWQSRATDREQIISAHSESGHSAANTKTLHVTRMLDAVKSLIEEGAQVIVLWEEPTRPTLVELVEPLDLASGRVEHVAIVVGPRLGLSRSEVAEAVSAGAHVATIGSTVMGNHIAAIAGLMALQHAMRA